MTGQEEYPRFISNRPCGNDKYEGKSQEHIMTLFLLLWRNITEILQDHWLLNR